ncbi:hydroxysteroid dehydrogenase-like protein 1 [Drosophila novamexicana]|uniref:hydroxysteroid dehydrogenase-like protein 1 n=1 Tax=Drosophila novamexicana TaxID=47314 RepID=UPI0011E604BC|nr:hydroxysteroid dehydrogenase-like protein 1 [Drosophila novamexicana]
MLAALLTFLSIVGFYALSCYLYEQLRTPYRLLKLRLAGNPKERLSLKERFGSWAAITGSSDGIGKAYAKELAREGINVVLIARNEEKLKTVAEEIASDCKVQTKIVVADFTHGAKAYEHIERELADLPVTILVNNVGLGLPGAFSKCSQEQTQQLVETNVMAVSQLSRYFLQRLRASKTKGAIVNVSSGTELQPVPYAALYAASKAYTRSFTLALQWEAAQYGIHVQLLSPNFVVTKINNYSKRIMQGGLLIPTAETYARSAVAQLRDGVDETPGYIWHHVQNAVMTAFPWRLRLTLAQLFFTVMADKKKDK